MTGQEGREGPQRAVEGREGLQGAVKSRGVHQVHAVTRRDLAAAGGDGSRPSSPAAIACSSSTSWTSIRCAPDARQPRRRRDPAAAPGEAARAGRRRSHRAFRTLGDRRSGGYLRMRRRRPREGNQDGNPTPFPISKLKKRNFHGFGRLPPRLPLCNHA